MPTKPKPKPEVPEDDATASASAFTDFLASADEYTPQERVDDVLAETEDNHPEPLSEPEEDVKREAQPTADDPEPQGIAVLDSATFEAAMAETAAYKESRSQSLEEKFRELVPEWTEQMGHSMFQVIRNSDGSTKVALAREAPGNYEG